MIPKLAEAMAIVSKLPDDLVEAATTRFDEIARETAGRAVGGTMTLHGRGGKRTPVTLATRSVVLGKGTHMAVVTGTPTAMWVWLQKGTQPHPLGLRRDDKVTFLHGARYEHPIAGPIEHPGSRGKGTWTATVNTFRREFPQLAVRTKEEAMRRAS